MRRSWRKIVFTGDVDAGKSTLIGRFLYEAGSFPPQAVEEIKRACGADGAFEFAYLADSFAEERDGRLTIDTTQVYCKAGAGRGFIFIDVPGHRELVKNMLCGSSYADAAVLVIDAAKGVEEQSKRHLFLLRFLGLEEIIVAVNKMDSAGFRRDVFEAISRQVEGVARALRVRISAVIPLSAKEGENLRFASRKMAWYRKATLAAALLRPVEKKAARDFRFPVQDIYGPDGCRMAVGAIVSGRIKTGEKVQILPLAATGRVKEIRVFREKRRAAAAPESIGLVLEDMAGLDRGQVICKSPLPALSAEFTARIFCVRTFNAGQGLSFCCATQETPVAVKRIIGAWDSSTLRPKSAVGPLGENDAAEAVLAAERPVTVESFRGYNRLGRFVLKAGGEIVALGIIV